MCLSSPKVPTAPKPLAAAPKMPGEVDRGTSKKKSGQSSTIKTSSRGIYQPLPGNELLGQ